MTMFFLLAGGGIASFVHFYLVWTHRGMGKYSISEHAIADKQSHQIYFVSHVVAEALILIFSYRFYVVEHHLLLPHYLNICFAIFDFVQAAVPSEGRTEKIHYVTAYVSWVSYITSGIIGFALLDLVQPFKLLALIFLIPAVSMFVYIHFKRSKLYPYQLAIVPSYVLFLFFVVLGAR